MLEGLFKEVEKEMELAIKAVRKEMDSIRTGRASVSLVEDLKVDYYGAPTLLKQLASISVPDATTIVIQPWDKASLKAIEKAILLSPLKLMPMNDGKVLRITLPPLTEERRQELIKLVKKKAEDGKVHVRNIRRDANEKLKEMKENGDISEDDYYKYLKKVQELTDKYVSKVDEILKEKEKEIEEE